jgi:hypothetical protein
MSEFYRLYQQMQNEAGLLQGIGNAVGNMFGGRKQETPQQRYQRFIDAGMPPHKAQVWAASGNEPPQTEFGDNPAIGQAQQQPSGPYNRYNVPGVGDARPEDRADTMAPNHNAGYRPVNWNAGR